MQSFLKKLVQKILNLKFDKSKKRVIICANNERYKIFKNNLTNHNIYGNIITNLLKGENYEY